MSESEKLRKASEWWLRLQHDSTPEQEGEWLAWSQADPANLDAFDRVEAMALELRCLSSAQRGELAREFCGAGQGEKMSFRWPLTIAATLVIAIAAVFYFKSSSSEATYATERALHQEVTLSDGSLLTVGASSVVSVHMRSTERHIRLRNGEAYFRVEKDAARPFIVEAGDVIVTALGTAFDVRRTGKNVAVSVTEGRVRITRSGGAAVEVNAGERVSYEPESQRFNMSAITPERATAWRDRRLEFVNEPLDVVVANLNRYANQSVTIADSAAGGLTFTGTVLPDSLPAWLNALPSVLPVQVGRRGKEVFIESASKP
jgi:transmembrane sensor